MSGDLDLVLDAGAVVFDQVDTVGGAQEYADLAALESGTVELEIQGPNPFGVDTRDAIGRS